MATGAESEKTVSILGRFRAPLSRVWGRKQVFDIITRYTLEETFVGLWQQAKTQEGPKL